MTPVVFNSNTTRLSSSTDSSDSKTLYTQSLHAYKHSSDGQLNSNLNLNSKMRVQSRIMSISTPSPSSYNNQDSGYSLSDSLEISLPVPLDLWETAEGLKIQLEASLRASSHNNDTSSSSLGSAGNESENGAESSEEGSKQAGFNSESESEVGISKIKVETEIQLAALLLRLAIDNINKDPPSNKHDSHSHNRNMGPAQTKKASVSEFLPLLTVIFLYFQDQFLSQNNIHCVLLSALRSVQQTDTLDISYSFILSTYYSALSLLQGHGLIDRSEYVLKPSALLEAASRENSSDTTEKGVKLAVIFGGQGNTEDYFGELSSLYRTYKPLLKNFMASAASTLSFHSSSKEAISAHGSSTINLLSWLDDPNTRPGKSTMLATDLSLPLIGLTQLVAYWVNLKVLDLTPAQMRECISGK
jgi:hypothetical protein